MLRRPPLARAALACSLAAVAALGCGAQSYNVRASRAYSNEDADLGVVNDRATDLGRSEQAVDKLLAGTPYTPGDRWPAGLRLDDDGADRIKARYADAAPYSGDHEVALAKLYRVELEQTLGAATAERASAPGKYPSLLDAVAAIAPGAAGMREEWRRIVDGQKALTAKKRAAAYLQFQYTSRGGVMGREPANLRTALGEQAATELLLRQAEQRFAALTRALSASGAATGDAQIVSRDALEAASYALRLHAESLAVAPYIVKQAKRLRRDGPVGDVIERTEDTSALAETEEDTARALAEALTIPAQRELAATGGFAMHENPIAQAARINFDATHIHVKGEAQLLLYHQLTSPSSSGGDNNYTGRTRRLEYSVDPVFMLGGRIIAAYDFLHVKNAASLNGGFTTDRLFSSGGEVQNQNSLGSLIGLHGFASDMFDIGADLMGIHTSIVAATFTSGEVRAYTVDPKTGADTGAVEKAPFQLTYHQVDVGYDFTMLAPDAFEELYVENLIVGFRYMDYRLPRILYEMNEQSPGSNTYVFGRETPPQSVSSRFYTGGLTLRMGQGDWPRVSFYGDLGLYGGGGPISYLFRPAAGPDEPHSDTMIAFNGSATLGARFRLTKRRRPRIVVDVSYHGEVVGQGILSQINETTTKDGTTYSVGKKIDVGGFDIFHGPRLLLVLVL